MGNLCLPMDAATQDIDDRMNEEKNRDHMQKKLLFLGAGGAGKSTIFKQLRYIHSQTMNDEERSHHIMEIRVELIESMNTLIRKSKQLYKQDPTQFALCQIPESPDIMNAIQHVLNIPKEMDFFEMDPEFIENLSRLWETEFIQETWKNREYFAISECVRYFFNEIDRVCGSDYVPTEKDLLLARVRTTGIIFLKFQVDGHEFLIVDVGGQRNERKKWINCFDNVTAVIFVASLTSYCEVLFEDENVNGMLESLKLFEKEANNSVFRSKDIILFLNKQDLFEERIRDGKMLTHCFKDEYQGQIYDPEGGTEVEYEQCLLDSLEFIQGKYSKLKVHQEAAVYIHLTTATDRDKVEKVFWDVQNIVMRGALKEVHLL